MPAAASVFHYRLAGLTIASEFELLEGGPCHDLACDQDTLSIASGTRLGQPVPSGGNARSRDGRRVRLVVPGVGCFLIDDGHRVVVWPESGTSAATLSQQLSGAVLALALMQRDVLVLHGSVIAFGGRAVVVMGHSGDGKSTTAAACARLGHAVLSDDLAPMDVADGAVTVRPTCALVRVGDAQGFGKPASERWVAADKTVVRVGPATNETALPVAAIVRLAVDDRVEVRTQTATSAALSLIEHTFCRPAFEKTRAAWAMQQCARIAGVCPVVTLCRPMRLDVLDDVVAHLARLTSASA